MAVEQHQASTGRRHLVRGMAREARLPRLLGQLGQVHACDVRLRVSALIAVLCEMCSRAASETTEDGGLTLNGSEPDVLPSFVEEAKKHVRDKASSLMR